MHHCHYWFVSHGVKFHDSVCNGCYAFTMVNVNISNIAIITIKNVNYCCIIQNTSKSKAVNLLENSVLENCGCL